MARLGGFEVGNRALAVRFEVAILVTVSLLRFKISGFWRWGGWVGGWAVGELGEGGKQ